MHCRSALRLGHCGVLLALAATVFTAIANQPARAEVSALRRTPIVNAIENVRSATVNIHGEKLVDANDKVPGDGKRKVNGMGTGVIVDERGYIVTNHHVVDGVKKIMVTTASRETLVAKLISHDPKTDLAVIKIDVDHDLDVIDAGTSNDLLCGETVIAVGNAYGYEHTASDGIISALHRSVQVSETQHYDDLIQTSAAINPGNSGGPLVNIEGKMIGLNVAVRAGAQCIGFAIPVDKVMAVATDLLSARRLDKTNHGLRVETSPSGDVMVTDVDSESPAAQAGLKTGDKLVTVNRRSIQTPLDIERAVLGRHAGDKLPLLVERDHKRVNLELALGTATAVKGAGNDLVWDDLGLKLEPVPSRQFQQYKTHYRGGLQVTDVRSDSPASKQGIRRGDILVGMHIWETVTLENVVYVLNRPEVADMSLKFYILRGSETLYGHLTVSHRQTTSR